MHKPPGFAANIRRCIGENGHAKQNKEEGLPDCASHGLLILAEGMQRAIVKAVG